jgi:hypothetical protein
MNFLIVLDKKTIDKSLKVCYNSYRKGRAGVRLPREVVQVK